MRVFAISLPGLVVALVAASAVAEDVDEVIVTAARTPVDADQLSAAITVIDREALALSEALFLADYLKAVPGVALGKSGSVGGQAQLRMRGGEANQTLVMIDGVEVNDPAVGEECQWEHLTTRDIERVEVIRSPMSATWGSEAVAGVVNIITREARDPVSFSLFGEYGAFDSRSGGGNLNASGDSWRLNLAATYNRSDGTNVSRAGTEDDGYRNTTLSAGGAVELSAATTVTAKIRHTDTRADYDGVDWMTGLPADSDHVTSSEISLMALGLTTELFDGRVSPSVKVTHFDSSHQNYAFGGDDGATSAAKLGFSADARVLISDDHTVTLAIDHEDTDFSQRGTATPFGDPNQDQDLSVTGFVGDYLGHLGERVTVSASVRYDKSNRFDDFTSWRFGASVGVSDTLSLFANVARGQKAPTFIERFGFFPDQFIGNAGLEPERSLGYEVGLRWQLARGRAGLTYFQSDLEDEINGFVFDGASGLFTADNMDEESDRKGVELTIEAELTDALRLQFSYTSLDATEGHDTAGSNRELRRPESSGAVSLAYRPNGRFRLSLSGTYTGEANDLFFPPWPNPSEVVVLDSYLLLGVAASYELTEGFTIYARVKNALDEDYEDVFGFSNPGVAASIGVRYRFD